MQSEAGLHPFTPVAGLRKKFRHCVRYKFAPAWQKPLLDPARFVRNQWRIRRRATRQPGAMARAAAFHLAPFTIVNGETVSENIATHGLYEPELTEAFLRLIEPGQVVLDIGMHLGYYATLFAQLVGPNGHVHAFEPTPSTRAVAGENVGRFANLTVHPFAVWSCVEKMEFNDYGEKFMAFNSFTEARLGDQLPTARKFMVEAMPLDDFCRKIRGPVALVKVDAESAESNIIAGAQHLLRSDQPLVSLEVGDFAENGHSAKLIGLMAGCGYQAWELADGRFARHTGQTAYHYGNLVFAPVARDLAGR